ncbi:MAG: deacylase [Candidatus Methylomirabilota bacterium]|nr:YbaK/EbsC family protein [Candidatus Methylomirabilis sp.]NJD68440.1 YbaK/EbsC family protein [candidate division NC10 bacterium]PWB46222.1 MAG: deacylase [candidate division NC10 bacterium]
MTVPARVREWLDQQQVRYEIIPHREVYTAQEVAGATHIPGRAYAKVVILKGRQGLMMAVLPAMCRLDIVRMRQVVGDSAASLDPETDFAQIFTGCEPGAMPAFGNLYGIPVYCDQHLTRETTIAFPAGSHHEVIRIASKDFLRITGAQVYEICTIAHEQAA